MLSALATNYHHGDLRNTILEVGIRHLEDLGPQKLSLRKVTEEIGVSHTAAYRHFSDKPAFLAELAAYGFDQLSARAREGFEAHGDDGRQALSAYGRAYVQFAAEQPELFRLTFAKDDDARVESAGQQAFDLLIEAVRRNAEAGVFGPGSDVMQKVVSCWSLVHGLAMLIVDRKLDPAVYGDWESLVDAALDDLWLGMARS